MSATLKAVWTGAGPWSWVHAILFTVLIAVLVAIVVLQGAHAHSPNRRTLRALSVVSAPLLVVFLVVVLQRFRELSF